MNRKSKFSGLIGVEAVATNTVNRPTRSIRNGDTEEKEASRELSDGGPEEISLNLIDRSPYQNRFQPAGDKISTLAEEIKRNGLNNPVIVRPSDNQRFELVAGETRVAAFRMLGKDTIPAFVRVMDNEGAAQRLVLDNFYHGDLSDYEIWRGLETLRISLQNQGKQGSLAEIASLTPWGRTHIHRLMSFSRLPEAALEVLSSVSVNLLGSAAAKELADIIVDENPKSKDLVITAIKALARGEIRQGAAAKWVTDALSREAEEDSDVAKQKSHSSEKKISLPNGLVACTLGKTTKGILIIKPEKGFDLSELEEKLAHWLTIQLGESQQ